MAVKDPTVSDHEIRLLYTYGGYTDREIGDMLGMTRTGIMRRRQKAGIASRPRGVLRGTAHPRAIPGDELAYARALREQRWTYRRIAAHLGIDYSSAYLRVNRPW